MRAVIDSIKGVFVRCLVENGDMITIHKNLLPAEVIEGDVLNVHLELDQEGTKRQRELMKSAQA
jgi:hypothetical protein